MKSRQISANDADHSAKIAEVYARIRDEIFRTPLTFSEKFSRETGALVYLKWECEQKTGSFKLRGALNKIRSLSAGQKKRGVVSASTGNHGLAISYAAKLERVPLTLFLPENAVREKVRKIEEFGVELKFHGRSCEKAEAWARRAAGESGRVYVSPYNDLEIIWGQGTCGFEIIEDLPDVEDVVVPIGGGGLIAGIGAFLKAKKPSVKIWGVEPRNSAFMKASLAAGRLVEIREKPTLADAVAGGIEPGAVTFPLCRAYVDGIITVGERRLISALRSFYKAQARILEGAGVLPVAGLMRAPGRFRGRKVVLVLSGRNIAPEKFASLLR